MARKPQSIFGRIFRHQITWTVVGILAGIATSHFYYEKALSAEVTEATSAGHAKGLAEGLEQARIAYEANLEKMLAERYSAELEDAKSAGQLAGIEQGRSEAQEASEKSGYGKGYEVASRECAGRRQAELRWTTYSLIVLETAKSAQALRKDPGNKELQGDLLARSKGLVNAAHELKRAYADQSTTFNGLIEDMDVASRATNFPALRESAIALSVSLGTKRSLFLDAEGRIAKVMDQLESMRNKI